MSKSKKTLIFLKKFNIKNPSLDEQNAFMMTEIMNEVECKDLGTFITNEVLYDKDLETFIPEKVKSEKPEWIVAVDGSASVALKLKWQKKILINPKVTFDDLNNVPEFARRHTFGFFDQNHEEDYNRFQSVYPNSAWYINLKDMSLFDIKDIAKGIIEED